MNLPSLQFIREKALETFGRFPFALLSAIIGTGAVLVLSQENFTDRASYHWLYNAWLAGFLGISLFVLAQLRAETAQLSRGQWLSLNLSVAVVLLAYITVLPSSIIHAPMVHLFRFLFFAAAAHFFVAVVPFAKTGPPQGFWEFNKSIFLRFLSACLYTHVLYLGLAVAMLAVDQLFSVNIAGRRYVQLWWFLVGVFNTWFFLSGVPQDVRTIGDRLQYPKGLKVFTQYVLIPLVVVYLAILYAYMFKIVIEWDWPKGWVGYLVLGFSTTGILSLLLVHPIKDSLENRWLAIVTQKFYLAIIPPAILLLLAIWRRVAEYGLTENRYIVIVLGCWLLYAALYFTFSRGKSIKVIPISLGILALAASVGPWGASSVSRVDQVGRLDELLTANRILADGKITPVKDTLPFDVTRQISSIVRYIVDVHGVEPLQPWFTVRLDSIQSDARYRSLATRDVSTKIVSLFGLNYVNEWERYPAKGKRWVPGPKISFIMDQSTIGLSGDQFVVGPVHFTDDEDSVQFRADNSEWMIVNQPERSTISFVRTGQAAERVEFPLSDLLRRLVRAHHSSTTVYKPADSLILVQSSARTRIRLIVRSIDVRDDTSKTGMLKMDFDAYVKMK